MKSIFDFVYTRYFTKFVTLVYSNFSSGGFSITRSKLKHGWYIQFLNLELFYTTISIKVWYSGKLSLGNICKVC